MGAALLPTVTRRCLDRLHQGQNLGYPLVLCHDIPIRYPHQALQLRSDMLRSRVHPVILRMLLPMGPLIRTRVLPPSHRRTDTCTRSAAHDYPEVGLIWRWSPTVQVIA